MSRSVLSGFRPDKTCAANFFNGFKNIPGKVCVNRLHDNYASVIREKHRILRRRRFIDKTPHANKEEVYQYKVTAHDVLSTI